MSDEEHLLCGVVEIANADPHSAQLSPDLVEMTRAFRRKVFGCGKRGL
jgi:hypothetical protein